MRSLIEEFIGKLDLDGEKGPRELIPGGELLPASMKSIDQQELILMIEAVCDGWLTSGRFNTEFEKKLQDFIGVRHVLTCNSGSSANLIALNTLTSPKLGKKAINRGDEVITVAAGFPTTVNPIFQIGAVPVFVDIELHSLNIDPSAIESAITEKTKAIVIAHALGNPFDLQVVREICDKYELWLVEDCCDALGSTYEGKHVGTFGDIASLSFYPAHHITTGEGGAVFMNSGRIRKIAESFRDWGRDCFCQPGEENICGKRFDYTSDIIGGCLPDGYDHKYIYSHLGYNLKITDMQAACGLAQMEKLEKFIQARRYNFEYLKQRLYSFDDFIFPVVENKNAVASWFGFPVVLNSEKVKRIEMLKYLADAKIGTRLLFAGNLTKQPYLSRLNYRISGSLSNTDYVTENMFWVGVHPCMRPIHLDYIASVIMGFAGRGC